VRAHIHIEARLNRVLEALTPFPEQLPKGLRYEQRVRLAVALGLSEEILKPLKILGDIRNDFAHALDVKLTDEMANRLWQSFSKDDKDTILQAYGNTQSQFKETGMPEFSKADARHRFIAMAVALDKYLIVSENEALAARHT
jgi:hypothetical protein